MSVGETVIRLLVDYGKEPREAIREGSYNWIDPDVTLKRFPSAGEGISLLNLVALPERDNLRTLEDAWRYVGEKGLRPANLRELLAFGAEHRRNTEGILLALGSVWNGPAVNKTTYIDEIPGACRRWPAIGPKTHKGDRCLLAINAFGAVGHWAEYRFLAVTPKPAHRA
ncbi:MAG: hypothetical protein M1153_01320 [Patescibacteria group bacterium]|nr:hypothetical protein [Patescibacteria group bacterium]